MPTGNNEERRRGPRDMQALLNFCTELTIADDTTQPSTHSAMDPERRAFLTNAIEGMQINVANQLTSSLQKLTKDAVINAEDDIEEQEAALEHLSDYCDDLDNAMDLHKIGGFPVVVGCLQSPHASLRARAASLIGDICQNCEYCQNHMLELHIMRPLLRVLDEDVDDEARTKALYAVSCLVRESSGGEVEFLEADGLSHLMRAMQSNVEKLIIKSCFLLRHLMSQKVDCQESIFSMGFIEQMVNILNSEDTTDEAREYCTSSLYYLAVSKQSILEECHRSEFGLLPQLKKRLSKIKGLDEYTNEAEIVTKFVELFPDLELEETLAR